ncbi:MOSC domain-containing protein [Jannaschia seohaensis]|uniref:MOSC domain-containing protein YiiM n=1 Tax=Jannaschia seohaensis TaxID=475081 RepID=A0A2Y9B079_9RHOB|nr:MOSC domain-containing protein [Jannaschia seohaensis]PWJ15061.1 MOSC domain-containing protein YiiM [Jannaschia seohaensis]SSA49910.1 MOSC domain-containing protein YiiM [Jannaschia seohaensis]
MTDRTTVTVIYLGRVEARWPGKPPSAIGKRAVDGPVALGATGLDGDAQADLRVHGGEGKAVHVYPAAHYPAWEADLGPNPRFAPGGFGENVSLPDWTEEDVCIGDVLRFGTATVAISQGRQPCWKLAAHVGVEDMVLRVRETLRTGWYLRVIEPGAVAAGDEVSLLERPHGDWSVRRAAAALFDPGAERAVLAELAGLADLDPTWRKLFAERAQRAEAGA